jgi:hypothetical protein
MLGLIKKLFGAKEAAPAPAVEAPAPYKVETPAVEAAPAHVVEAQPAPVEPAPAAKPAKKPAAKKPAAPAKEELPWKKSENPFTLEAQGKKVESKADKFDSLFNDDDNDLPF